MAGVAVRDALQVILVLRFGFPEGADRRHLGHDLSRPQVRCVHVRDGIFGNALLLGAGVEDRRAIAGAPVVALAVDRRRIVNLEDAPPMVGGRIAARPAPDSSPSRITSTICES